MRKVLFISVLFLTMLISALINAMESKKPIAQSGDIPRAFLQKPETKFTIHGKDESISLYSNRLTLEEILERIAFEKNVTLKFYCEDPGLKQERPTNLRISGDSMVKVLGQLLPDYKFALFDVEGKAMESGKNIASIIISPKECTVTDSPVRVFTKEKGHPLRKRPEEISLDELMNVIKREGPAARRRAAEILGSKDDEKAIACAQLALKDENPEVMFAAAKALKRLGQKYGFERVSECIDARFREKPYPEFLPVIAEVDKDRIWPIADRLMDQSGEKEKNLMLRALSLTNDRKAVKYLARISFSDIENTRQAIYAIGRIGGPEASTELMRLLKSGDAQGQALAAQAVHFLPKGEGSELRAEVERIVKGERVSELFLAALLEVSYFEPFEKLLIDPASKPELKIRALNAIGQRGTEKAINFMSAGIDDKSAQVRMATVEAMASISVDEAIPHLVRATGDKDAKVRTAAIKGLSDFHGNEQAMEALGKALQDPDQNARRAAVDGIRLLGKPDDKMIAILKECENHKDPYVAEKAQSTLKDWGLK